jgi:hypothetical protein
MIDGEFHPTCFFLLPSVVIGTAAGVCEDCSSCEIEEHDATHWCVTLSLFTWSLYITWRIAE